MKNFSFWVRVFSIFCTYISERVFITIPDKPERGGQTICTIPARRVALVKQRVRENTRRRQRREAISLSAFCLMLFTALAGAADALIVRGQTAAWGVFGTRLLREDAGGYVLVAVVSFAAAAAITALCIRLRNRKNQKKGGTNKPAQYEQEEKSQ